MNTKQTLTALSICALFFMGGCQKESETLEPRQEYPAVPAADGTIRIHYRIGNSVYQASFCSEEELKAFLHYLNGLAREGEKVSVSIDDQQRMPASKEVIVFYSTDEEEMANWAYFMIKNGYTVEITYDEEKGLYTGTATSPN